MDGGTKVRTIKVASCFLGFGVCGLLLMLACTGDRGQRYADSPYFSKADSLTEMCLGLQDTMLQVWHTMIHDDNRKIRAMSDLLQELKKTTPEDPDVLNTIEGRLRDLMDLRYDQQSMSDPERVSEYDFASNSLVSELIAITESQKEFEKSTTLQKLVDSIRSSDQRVMNYRAEYDDIAIRFNSFIDRYHQLLDDVYADSFLEKKPLFQMAAE